MAAYGAQLRPAFLGTIVKRPLALAFNRFSTEACPHSCGGGSLKSLILFLFFLCGSTGAQAAIYSLDGVHSKYGSYQGELELRPSDNGQVQVIRVVTDQNFLFEGFQVQEVWKGSGILQGNLLSAVFKIKQADLFNQVDNLKRTKEQFTEPVKLAYQMD